MNSAPVRFETRRWLAVTCAVATYIGVALYAYWPASLLSNSRLAGGGQGDPAGQVAGLAWIAFAISHHTNPFITNWINYPQGVNLASNAVAPLIGLLLSPITFLLGPVAAYNFALCLAFVSAACSMFLVLRVVLRSTFAAFLGGLLYGFSPYMVGQGLGHLAILYTALTPVVFYLLYRLFQPSALPRRRIGFAVGLVLALQVYLSVEILADLVTVAVILIFALMLLRPRSVVARGREVVWPLAIGIATFLVVSGYPIWMLLFGPQHLSGPPQPTSILEMFHSDILGPLVPIPLMRFSPSWLSSTGARWSAENFAEYGIYLGVPIVAAIIGTAVWMRRDSIVRLATTGCLIAFVFSLGNRLTIAGHRFVHFPMPFAAVSRLPLFSGEVPSRYSLFVQLFAAVVLASGVDRLVLAIGRRWDGRSRASQRSRFKAVSLVTIGSVALFVPIVPTFPYAQGPANVPTFFSTRAVKRIPFGSVLLAYPYPGPPIYNEAQLWQAETNYRFKILGGYAIFRTANGSGSPIPPQLQPSTVQDIFSAALFGPSPAEVSSNSSSVSRQISREIRTFLRKYHVATVAIDPIGKRPFLAVRYMSAVLGHPVTTGGMTLWFDVPRLLKG